MEKIIHGDALDVLRGYPSNSVDALCCDPPAGISFMNVVFDSDRGGRDHWIAWLTSIMREALRVLKPGAHAFVWALPRTSHWTAMALEDAGFEIRDVVSHLFGSGFPKSHNVSIAIDKHLKADREVIGHMQGTGIRSYQKLMQEHGARKYAKGLSEDLHKDGVPLTAPATPEAEQWQGWGSALKPSHENWILARKPLAEPSIAANVLEWGTGALNIDASRVGTSSTPRKDPRNGKLVNAHIEMRPWMKERIEQGLPLKGDFSGTQGRFPSNTLISHSIWCVPCGEKRVRGSHDGGKAVPYRDTSIFGGIASRGIGKEAGAGTGYADEEGMETVPAWDCAEGCPVRLLEEMSGNTKSVAGNRGRPWSSKGSHEGWKREAHKGYTDGYSGYTDEGGAARYFQCFPPEFPFIYVSKASRWERNEGCGELPEHMALRYGEKGQGPLPQQTPHVAKPEGNHHPTVKSLSLMRYLIRLITPPGGIVLDCFGGSGSTAVAAITEGFDYLIIEKEQEYIDIIRARVAHALGTAPLSLLGREKGTSRVYSDGNGLGTIVSRCPDHDAPRGDGNFYKCGCKFRRLKARSAPKPHTKRHVYDGPSLWQEVV
jgi:DNA modification methylase